VYVDAIIKNIYERKINSVYAGTCGQWLGDK